MLYIAVKKLRKSVDICQSYHKNKRVSFFMAHSVLTYWLTFPDITVYWHIVVLCSQGWWIKTPVNDVSTSSISCFKPHLQRWSVSWLPTDISRCLLKMTV